MTQREKYIDLRTLFFYESNFHYIYFKFATSKLTSFRIWTFIRQWRIDHLQVKISIRIEHYSRFPDSGL